MFLSDPRVEGVGVSELVKLESDLLRHFSNLT